MSKTIMPKVWTKFIALALVAGSAVYLGSCANQTTSQPPTTAQTAVNNPNRELREVRFTLSWLLQAVDAPLAIAIQKGYFAEEGIAVRFDRGYGSADSINKIASGVYDIGEGDMYSMVEFNQKNPNDKLVAVAIKYNRSPFAIMALDRAGISSPQQLEGKRLAAPAGDAARRLWPVFAQVTGVNPDSVTWNNVEPRLREALLVQGEFDAISGFNISSLPPLNKLGYGPDRLNTFLYADHGLDLYGNALIVRESFLEQNPEVVRGFVSAYLRGLQDTIRNPDEGLAAVMELSEDGLMDQAQERERLQIALDSLYVSPEVEQNGLGGVDRARLQTTLEQVAKGFGLAEVPTPEDVFNDSFLPPKEQRTI
ncbi:ABC transporter substrate-binding protein [Chroococcidiopsis sp. TS-821]|uniref:ABC transporter substrate-binding protein n=1 Tax=Chroococcidiopsis sp. TS-821 TaxID=1378066 RepID=UPI001AEF85E1|nr:ABC transporter substrate-binding protein [Chroococcidiopsis sp. TS-821]